MLVFTSSPKPMHAILSEYPDSLIIIRRNNSLLEIKNVDHVGNNVEKLFIFFLMSAKCTSDKYSSYIIEAYLRGNGWQNSLENYFRVNSVILQNFKGVLSLGNEMPNLNVDLF